MEKLEASQEQQLVAVSEYVESIEVSSSLCPLNYTHSPTHSTSTGPTKKQQQRGRQIDCQIGRDGEIETNSGFEIDRDSGVASMHSTHTHTDTVTE